MLISNEDLLSGTIGTLKASRRKYKITDRMGSNPDVKLIWLDTKEEDEVSWLNLLSATDMNIEVTAT